MPLFSSVKTHVPERFCGGDLNPLLVFVKKSQQTNLQQMPDAPIQDGFFLKLDRKWRCSLCCFNRSPLDVIYMENGQNVFLGQIEVPYAIIHQTCNIYDRNNNLKYNITQRLLGESTKLSFFPWEERESQLFQGFQRLNGFLDEKINKKQVAAILMFECMYF